MNSGNPGNIQYYYVSIVSLWNNVNHNSFPDLQYIQSLMDKEKSSNQSVSDGIPFDPFTSTEELSFGNYFEENEKIRALYPSEGDVIVEGRFGNSIRFGSSAPTQVPRNDWSTEAENGKPVVIIRNGQREITSPNPWDPVFENINQDGSSIYMLSEQPLRAFNPAYNNLQSLNINYVGAGDTSQEIVSNLENLIGLGDDFSGDDNPTTPYQLGEVIPSSLSLEDTEALGKELTLAYLEKGYERKENKWELNITGVRTKGKRVTNKFDDWLIVDFIDESDTPQLYQFPITTQPGDDWVLKPYTSLGAAILKPGQYKNAYKWGIHKTYEAIVDATDLVVFRDPNKDLVYDDPNLDTQTGEFGINIHRSNPTGTSVNVNQWSAGCQVFANSEDFKVFLNILGKSYQQLGKSKTEIRYTYTLLEEDDVQKAIDKLKPIELPTKPLRV